MDRYTEKAEAEMRHRTGMVDMPRPVEVDNRTVMEKVDVLYNRLCTVSSQLTGVRQRVSQSHPNKLGGIVESKEQPAINIHRQLDMCHDLMNYIQHMTDELERLV